MKKLRLPIASGLVIIVTGALAAQNQQSPGRPIGTVTTQGDLIVLELDADAIAPARLFDLGRRTLHFTPDGAGYRVENVPVTWDKEFGAPLTGFQVTLHNFSFPFSGQRWDAFSVGQTGTISFGAVAGNRGAGAGATVGRFAELRTAAPSLVNTSPVIDVFLKPRMSGPRFVKELADRVVVTWTLTEPSSGVFDYSWAPTVNRFQAVLMRDGTIDLSYDELAAQDAIVGVYPMVTAGKTKPLAEIGDAEDAALPEHLDVRKVTAAAIDGLFLAVTLDTRGPILPEGDPRIVGVTYRVSFDADAPLATTVDAADADVVWTIRGIAGGGRGGGAPRYVVAGPGVSPAVKVDGNTISVRGAITDAFKRADRIAMFAEAIAPGADAAVADQVPPRPVTLAGIVAPEIDLSKVTRRDGPFPVAYEAFHHAGLPRPADMACTVIRTLGDRFDFLAWYSDFRVDNQEAGTPSTGPMDTSVTGIRRGTTGGGTRGPASFCSGGRLQSTFIQPVYIGSNQGQERSPDGTMTGYNLAMSQIGHELGHRWMAFADATVNGETFPLGPTHWARGLQAPAAYPYRRPVEASAMGGGAWQENADGTFTQLDDDFYVPATGYSHLDLYLMGLMPASEVPDFFILKNLVAAGTDANGKPLYRGDKVKVTVQDVIAADGPRLPAYEQSQKAFNTGIVAIVLKGHAPSRALIERANGIRTAWIEYWTKTTGGRATMTTTVR